MGAQLVIGFLLTLSIVTSGLLLAHAQKAETAAAPGKNQAQAVQEPQKPESKASASQSPDKPDPFSLPLMLELIPGREMYRPKEDMMIKAELWAVQPTTVCIYPDHPEANFSVELFRAGHGKVHTLPNVVQFNRQELFHIERIKLEPGQMYPMVFNLKKLVTMPPSFWKTGEYKVQGKFFLCGKGEQGEKIIAAQTPLRILVLD